MAIQPGIQFSDYHPRDYSADETSAITGMGRVSQANSPVSGDELARLRGGVDDYGQEAASATRMGTVARRLKLQRELGYEYPVSGDATARDVRKAK